MTIEPFETEFYEMTVPGKLIGKEIIDSEARRIGLCHSIKMRFFMDKKQGLKNEVFLVVKGLGIEFNIPMEDVDLIGNVIKLKVPAKQAEEIAARDVIRLQEDIAGEIRARASKI